MEIFEIFLKRGIIKLNREIHGTYIRDIIRSMFAKSRPIRYHTGITKVLPQQNKHVAINIYCADELIEIYDRLD